MSNDTFKVESTLVEYNYSVSWERYLMRKQSHDELYEAMTYGNEYAKGARKLRREKLECLRRVSSTLFSHNVRK